MTDEQNNVEARKNDEEESPIKSAAVHLGSTTESQQPQAAFDVEVVDMPLRLLVLGDFTPNAEPPEDWASVSPPIRVEPSNFGEVMERFNPGLKLDVPNHLENTPKTVKLELRFPNMRAFSPEGVADSVDSLSALLQIRQLAVQLKRREIELPEFEEQLGQIGAGQAWGQRIEQLLKASDDASRETEPTPQPPSPEPKAGGGLDSLLNMVDVEETETPSSRTAGAKSPVDDLVRAIVGTKGRGVHASVPDAIVDAVDQTLGKQLNAVLHHSDFQRLESTWRGLKFLIDRTNFRENVQLELLSVPKEHLRDAIYQQVFQPEYNDLSEYPLSVIIADYEFDSSPTDVELLGDIARMAASMQVPFIASVGPAFYGVKTAEEQAKVPMLRAFFEKPEYTKWRALREDDASQFIALTTSRFLLRYPYGPNGEAVKAFNFTETAETSTDYLWGRGAFALATTLVRSYIERGWCTQIAGQRGGGIVSSLPLWPYRAAGRQVQIPIDLLYSQSKELEFGDAGLALLSCRINSDAAFVLSAPTIHRPKRYSTPEETKEEQLHAALPYQLFATRMAHCLRVIMRNNSTGLTPEQISDTFSGQIRSVLAKASDAPLPEEAVVVEVSEGEENLECYEVFLRIRPPFRILGRSVDLVLGLELPR